MEIYNAQYLNAYFKSNEDLKDYLEREMKIVLPSLPQRGVTTNWLLKVAREEVFVLPEGKYQHFRGRLHKKATKQEIHQFILDELKTIGTGFDDECLPEKSWLLDLLYSINSKHPLFERISDNIPREFPKK